MARCLIIGCGCRGELLAGQLLAAGHAVRGTTRHPARLPELAAAGIEPHLGDPDRVATLTPAFEHVTIACVLLGSARGTESELAALHGSRLEMLLLRMLDTTIHGIVYEAPGSVDPDTLSAALRIVRASCEASLIPYVLLEADPSEHTAWLAAAGAAVAALM